MTMDQLLLYEAALQLQKTGYEPVVLRWGTKAASFREWQKRGPLTRFELRQHFRRRLHNVGIWLREVRGPPRRLLVLDLDDAEAVAWADGQGLESPMASVTSGGEHRYFVTDALARNVQRWRGLAIDLLVNGYAAAPPSWLARSEHRYRWKSGIVPPDDLPLFPGELLREEPEPERTIQGTAAATRRRVERRIRSPIAYAMQVESIQGAGGSRGLVRFISILRDGDVPADEAWDALLRWNASERVSPPWDIETELRRAFDRHFFAR